MRKGIESVCDWPTLRNVPMLLDLLIHTAANLGSPRQAEMVRSVTGNHIKYNVFVYGDFQDLKY